MSESEMHVHEYDGIEELDNQLPRWWLLLFYFTIAFGVVYLVYYHVLGKGVSNAEAYAAEVAAVEELRASLPQPVTGGDGATPETLEPSTDPAVLAEGKTIFGTYCFTCHAPDGGGLVGPNMTDDYFIHGPTFADSLRTATEGVPEKGMIAWKTALKPDQIYAVTSYIWTLRGTKPATPKAPEGEHYPPQG